MAEKIYPNFNFNLSKINDYINELKSDEEQLTYLNFIKQQLDGSVITHQNIVEEKINYLLNLIKVKSAPYNQILASSNELNLAHSKLHDCQTTYMQIQDYIIYLKNSQSDETEGNKKIKWCDNNYLSLMGLIELLEEAGLVPEKSFENSGSIASNNFLKRDNQEISRNSFNRKKLEYEDKKEEILEKLINRLNQAYDQIIDRM